MAEALSITAAALCAAATLIAPPYRWYGYRPLETPRRAFLAMAAAITFAIWASAKQPWPATVFPPAIAVGIWLLAGSVVGSRPKGHIGRLVSLSAAWWLAAVLAPGAGAIAPALMAAAAAVQSLILIVQYVFGLTMFQSAAALIGNTNLLGAFLAPCVFFSLCAGLPLPVASVITAATLLTRCRAAVVGLAIGAIAYPTAVVAIFYGVLVYAAVLVVPSIQKRATPANHTLKQNGWLSPPTLIARSKMWRVAIAQIRKRWFAGSGLDGLKPFVAQRSRAIGSPGVTFRKAHSDVMQIAVDAGLFGLALFAAAVSAVCGIGFASSDPVASIALAALAAQLGCGLFLHTIYLPMGQLTFFLACGLIIDSSPAAAHPTPLPMIAAVAGCGLIAWRSVGWRFFGDYFHGRFVYGRRRTQDGEAIADVRDIRRAISWVPDDSTARFNAAEAAASTGSPLDCQRHLWHAIATYDGEIRLAPVIARIGHHFGRSFSVELDAAACRYALALEPGLASAQAEIARIREGLTPERIGGMPVDVARRVMALTAVSTGKEPGCSS